MNVVSYLTAYFYTRACGGSREEAAAHGEAAAHEPTSGTLRYSPWTGLTLEGGVRRIEAQVGESPYYDAGTDRIVPPDLQR